MDSESPIDPVEANDSSEAVEPVEVARYAEPIQAAKVVAEVAPEANHELPPQFRNVAAKGGAVAAIVLGSLSVFGAFVTQWSLFNAFIGLLLGLWGLNSPLRKTSVAGICFCLLGLVLCFAMFRAV